MTRQQDGTSETGGVILKYTGTSGVSSLWVLGPMSKEHGKWSRHVFL